MVGKLTNYVKDSVAEMKKVTWPTRKETYNYTFLVIGMSVALAAFLGGMDYLFNMILEIVVK